MRRIKRTEAIEKICESRLLTLNLGERESIILSWWGIDEEDIEFSSLSDQIRCQILENDEPPVSYENSMYDELILIALFSEYKGVRNTFIAEMMLAMSLGTYQVEGEVEPLEACPCCKYRTLEARGEYHICGLCYWEDCGVDEADQYSGPNHMSLGEARETLSRKWDKLPINKWLHA